MSLNRLILAPCFLAILTLNAEALTVNVDTSETTVKKFIHIATGTLVDFEGYSFSIDGTSYPYIESGGLSYRHINDNEKVYFETSTGDKIELDFFVSQRLLQLLTRGWQSVIKFRTPKNIPTPYGGPIPPGSYVMYYLGFNYSCFTTLTPEVHALAFPTEKIADIVKSLTVGDIVLLAHKENTFDKSAVMYIGHDLFLWWNMIQQRFYVRHFTHIDRDLFPKNRHLLKVVSVWPKELPKPEVLTRVLDSWKDFQQKSSDTDTDSESGVGPSAPFSPPIPSGNLPASGLKN